MGRGNEGSSAHPLLTSAVTYSKLLKLFESPFLRETEPNAQFQRNGIASGFVLLLFLLLLLSVSDNHLPNTWLFQGRREAEFCVSELLFTHRN